NFGVTAGADIGLNGDLYALRGGARVSNSDFAASLRANAEFDSYGTVLADGNFALSTGDFGVGLSANGRFRYGEVQSANISGNMQLDGFNLDGSARFGEDWAFQYGQAGVGLRLDVNTRLQADVGFNGVGIDAFGVGLSGAA